MRTRLAGWLVCGPLGHLAAGVADWVVLLAGVVVKLAVGAWLAALIVTVRVVVPVNPPLSVTVSDTVYVPASA